MLESCVRRSQQARARLQVGCPIALILVSLMLTSCTALQRWNSKITEAPPAPATTTASAPQPPVPPPPKLRRVFHEPREIREPEKVASIDPKNLIGLQPAAVEKLLGTPSAVTSNDPSLVWTYAGQGCSFRVFFYPDLKTATFHALKYASTANDQADTSCIRSILTVKNNGPS